MSSLSMLDGDCICVTNKGKPIKAKTVGQKKYVDKIKNNTVVFGVGPAGTGKTFLAVAMAVTALKNKQISAQRQANSHECQHCLRHIGNDRHHIGIKPHYKPIGHSGISSILTR